MASITNSMPLLGESSPNVRMTVLLLKPSLAFACSGSTNGKSGVPCAMTSIFSAGTRYTARSSSRPFSAMTMTRDDTSTMRFMTSRCTGVGSARTVCSVVTIGMVSRDSSAMMWPPASPPKMPNSCWRQTISN